jgi:DNA-binding transcriptional ArsR family regulator
MTGRILVCKCCGEPLKIVCPNHGSDYGGVIVPDHREHIGIRSLRPGTVRERLFLALPADTDPRHGPIDQLAERLGVTDQHVRAELAELLRRGLIHRRARGQYVRGSQP